MPDGCADPDAASKLELLREFLEKSNFNDLRASDQRLAGDIESKVEITRDENGKPGVVILTEKP